MEPYYEHAGITIYHGDALDVLPGLPNAGAFVLDPPYSMSPNTVRGRDDGAAGSSGAPIRLLTETFDLVRASLTPGGIAATVCDWRRVPDVSYIGTRSGLRLATCVAWTRKRPGTGGLFRGAWDPILVFSSGSPDYVDRSAVRNVVEIEAPTKRCHPYEKPPALWGHFIQRVDPEALWVDPFAGSGSSLVAIAQAGRKAIGIEIEEKYCEIAAKRLAQEVLPFGGPK